MSLSGSSVEVATFVGQSAQASVTIWNSGGSRLTGSASVGAPFSLVSGGSFSLNPGQPQEIVVRFAPGAAGGYNANLQISSNGGNQSVALRGGTITVSPASLSYTAFVDSPQEQKITLKNDGPVAATVNLGQVSAPFAFKSAGGVYSSAALEL
ncbi:MAG: choice-of-anchor D domain-containing protein, partial [Candidatus Caldarchaeum sp.]